MNAYIDLSVIVFIFNYTLSLLYSIILFDSIKLKIKIIVITILLSVIAFIINMYFIPYFLIFFLIIYSLILGVIKIHYIKIIICSLFIYYINCGLMLLIFGFFLYQGALLISIPFISLFILIQPIYISLIHIISTIIYKQIRAKNFIYKCKVIKKDIVINGKGYYDTGNFLTYKDIPVIFINGRINENDGEIIKIKGINNYELKYIAYKGLLVINKKNINVYIVFVDNGLSFNGCNILLNKYVL